MSNSHFEVLAQCKTGYGTHRLPSWQSEFETREEATAYLEQHKEICPRHNSPISEVTVIELGQSHFVRL
jgi:hypothetical protein